MSGAIHATARRGSIAEDFDFIRAKAAKGVPVSAIARMLGRAVSDVQIVAFSPNVAASERAPEPPPPSPHTLRMREWRKKVRSANYRPNRERGLPKKAAAILNVIARYHGVTVEEIVGRGKRRALAHIRQETYAALHCAGYNLVQVGGFIGGRDHGTVHSGIARHKARLVALVIDEPEPIPPSKPPVVWRNSLEAAAARAVRKANAA